MSFIGNVPAEAYSPVAKDTFSGNDSTTDFTLSIPATTNSVEVFVENVQQEPTTAYTISGTTLSFTAAPTTGTNNIYVIHRGPAVQTVVPPAGVALNPSTVTATGDISTEGDLKVETTSGGIYTITGTDTATNRTLTLPDEAGTVITSGASGAVTSSMLANTARGLEFVVSGEALNTSSTTISSTYITTDYATYVIDFAMVIKSGSAQQLFVSFSADNGSSYFLLDSGYSYNQMQTGSTANGGTNLAIGGVGGHSNNAALIGANVTNGDLVRGTITVYNGGRFSASETASRANDFRANVRSFSQQNNTTVDIDMVDTFIREGSGTNGSIANNIKLGVTGGNTMSVAYSVYGVSGT